MAVPTHGQKTNYLEAAQQSLHSNESVVQTHAEQAERLWTVVEKKKRRPDEYGDKVDAKLARGRQAESSAEAKRVRLAAAAGAQAALDETAADPTADPTTGPTATHPATNSVGPPANPAANLPPEKNDPMALDPASIPQAPIPVPAAAPGEVVETPTPGATPPTIASVGPPPNPAEILPPDGHDPMALDPTSTPQAPYPFPAAALGTVAETPALGATATTGAAATLPDTHPEKETTSFFFDHNKGVYVRHGEESSDDDDV